MFSFLLIGLLVFFLPAVALAQDPPSVAPAEKATAVAGRELDGWAGEVGHENRFVRLRAARSLAPFGAAAGEALRGALDSEDAAVRYIAAVDLGRIGGEPLTAAVERLTALRGDAEHPAVQMAAAFALCRNGKTEGNRSLLVERLKHADRGMACSAAELLKTLDPSSSPVVAVPQQSEADSPISRHAVAGSPVEPEEPTAAEEEGRPHILWIVCEGISPRLGSDGDPPSATPHLDRLGSQGARFTRAFAPAGVGEVVRRGVAAGRHPPSMAAQHMPSRSVPPAEVRCFSEYLRAAGYFCTYRGANDSASDLPSTAWDLRSEQHEDWRERPEAGQPFFAVVSLAADEIEQVDREVGEVLDRLAEDGLAEKTLVVFWSDCGRGVPGDERGLSDDAVRIPLRIRWPSQIPAGTVREDLVSVLDLPPTMLAAAGLRLPASMQGRTLWGDTMGDEPAYLFFHRDRIGETYDLRRGCRDRRWKYIRNYETRDSEKPIEELYDCQSDPEESENLADRPQYAERLARMRRATERWQQEIGDGGMIPEAVMMHELRPGGRVERTAIPSIRRTGSAVVLYCSTEGASVAYRIGDGERWSAWKLYTDGFPLEEGQRIEAKGVRWGFSESEIAKIRN